jgi:UDP-glucuronate 4-epimerase
MNKNKKVLVTGAAGFIGFNLVGKFIKENYEVIGLDIINNYYDVNLKYARLGEHGILKEDTQLNQLSSSIKFKNYKFLKADLSNNEFIIDFMISQKFDYVVNLAAQAGVRFSINHPFTYIDSNVTGFLSILEGCRYSDVKHLLYASTSSVYGLNTEMPLCETMPTEHPMA